MLLSTTCVGRDFINVFNKGVIKVVSLPVWTLVAPLRCISVRWESKFSCRLLPATYKLHALLNAIIHRRDQDVIMMHH